MKSKIKIEYVEAEDIDELNKVVSSYTEAIQVNIKNKIKDVDIIAKPSGGYIAQITYEELEEPHVEVLNENNLN